MRRNVSRGIFMASTRLAALTVADAPLSSRSPRSPTTVRPPVASISARSRSRPPVMLLLTSTRPEVRTKRLPGSPPSSMITAPAPKVTSSELSANSSRSSSVRNSKNLTPCSLSSTIPTVPQRTPCNTVHVAAGGALETHPLWRECHHARLYARLYPRETRPRDGPCTPEGRTQRGVYTARQKVTPHESLLS